MTERLLSTIDKFLEEKSVVILDGGFSNQLKTYNYDFEQSDLWTSKVLIDRPDLIKNVHRDYLDVGSDIITTVTYQATFQKLREKFNFTDQRIYELFELAIRMSEEAINEFMKDNASSRKARPIIAISIGSYGAYMGNGQEYKGQYDLDENGLIDFHRERLNFIASKVKEAPDRRIIAIETIPNLFEVKALITVTSIRIHMLAIRISLLN